MAEGHWTQATLMRLRLTKRGFTGRSERGSWGGQTRLRQKFKSDHFLSRTRIFFQEREFFKNDNFSKNDNFFQERQFFKNDNFSRHWDIIFRILVFFLFILQKFIKILFSLVGGVGGLKTPRVFWYSYLHSEQSCRFRLIARSWLVRLLASSWLTWLLASSWSV